MSITNMSAELTTKSLAKRDTEILKGVGILFIFLHNYLHWLPGLAIENEFVFRQSNIVEYVTHAFSSAANFIAYSFAYFGHFGVQIF